MLWLVTQLQLYCALYCSVSATSQGIMPLFISFELRAVLYCESKRLFDATSKVDGFQ